jgi:methylglutaconyl-CoA hydratase
MYRYIEVRREGAVERVTLNRPEVRNAFNDDMIAELTAWADAVATDGAVRVAVISGAGRAFSAGADVTWMARMAGYSHDENLRDAYATAQMFSTINRLPIPTVAQVHGAAIAGGAGLVAVCDIAVCTTDTVFGFTEVKLGIVPATISPFVLDKIGRSAARELFLTGARVSAQRAKDIGLVHAVVSDLEIDAAVDTIVGECLSAGPQAIATTKRLIDEVPRLSPDVVGNMTATTLAERRASDEGQEGLRAFLDKRKARWNDT